ncbi:MAG: hypothetical protein A2506_10425 [Elusimicrobia bacterium RIFOXYD12_FULL_66_9]|nr:MAG: hypothetical protein A2506_10425 [Elusimicrobia bacterium RIFOXYD12_FULL_66_9]
MFLHPGKADDPRLVRAVLDGLAGFLDRQAEAHDLDYVELRGAPLLAVLEGGFVRREPYVSFILDLSGGYERVRRGYSGNIVENLRKADRSADVSEGGAGDFSEDLYRIYLAQMRKFGSPPLPIGYFSGLLACGLARVYTARVAGRVTGFLMVLVQGGRMSAEINASLGAFDSHFPKVRLFDHAIRSACLEGLAEFDFMRTRRDSGVYLHKKKWGGREVPIPYFFRVRRGGVPAVSDAAQRRYLLPRLFFACAPASVASRLGPRVRSWIGK